MSSVLLAVSLACISSVVYAGAAVVQELAASGTTRPGDLSMLRRSTWWLAAALNLVGGALHVGALRYGSLTMVQSLGALTLVAAVPMSAATHRRRVAARQWSGTALTVSGLIGVLLFARATGPGDEASFAELLVVGGITALVLAASFSAAVLSRRRSAASLWFAVGAGASFGAASVLTQTVVMALSHRGLSGFRQPAIALAGLAVAVLSLAGALLSHNAYRFGLGAPLATLTLVNPLYAGAVGLTLLDQHHAAGLHSAMGATAAVAVTGAGVFLLTRAAPSAGSPLPNPALPNSGLPNCGLPNSAAVGTAPGEPATGYEATRFTRPTPRQRTFGRSRSDGTRTRRTREPAGSA
ncbi:hypothetical protein GCM10009837_18700 [Streptomyces durmitorensis]|uniref:DMT family transporter n=1 Tax=Streptomyces durmitorensis TaxID=319947 RepID=A0ABY4PPB2_9ACTN|nr:DMT family transporter [Streptomyces durmitorensis]UQT55451.1 DMT family transporter [Streptomyces durmitorensis]